MNTLRSQVDRRMYNGCGIEATVNSFKVFDQLDGNLEMKNEIEEELRSSVPDTLFRDTVGEYMYGCYTKQDEISPECTPSCIKGFSNTKLGSCKFPIIELVDGQIKALNNIKGDKAYLFTSRSSDVTDDILTSILTKFGIKKVEVFTYVGDKVEYTHYKTLSTKVEKKEVIVDSGNNNWTYVIVILVLLVIVAVAALLFTKSRRPVDRVVDTRTYRRL